MKTDDKEIRKNITLDYLYLDLNSCTRCVGTDKNLETAINMLRDIFDVTGIKLTVNKILIDTEAKAREYNFEVSPTIRINDRDIALDAKESCCDSCTDLSGCEEGTDCRVWEYNGKEYTEAPVGLIVEALLREIFGSQSEHTDSGKRSGDIPENLKSFFRGKQYKNQLPSASCCDSDDNDSCCDDTPEKD